MLRRLFEILDCTMIPLYCSDSGIFPHDPEPLTKNLPELAKAVKDHNADLGVAVDPDADRLVLIDSTGTAIGEEKTICVATQSLFELKKYSEKDFGDSVPKVVVNQSTTQLIDDITKKYNAELFRSAVGEINVVKKMQEVGAVIGGEGSGGVILPDSHYGRDSLIGTVLVLSLMAQKNATLQEINSEYPVYEMQKNKIIFNGNFAELCEDIQNKFYNNKISKIDGLKIYFDNAWIHMRVSNTEPVVRIIAEAPSKSQISDMMSKIKQLF